MVTIHSAENAGQSEYFSARQLSAKISVHPRTVHRWSAAGAFPAYKINPRVVRFRLTEVEKFITAGTVNKEVPAA